MGPRDEVFVLDDFSCWIDGDSIQVKAVTGHGDPVDFGTGEVRAVIAALARMVEAIDGPAGGAAQPSGFSRS